ncbi:MAG TPA: SDR family oxidoreductase [Ktedonobacterales bacterium]|nr:SDR family oxidoreductase [Ktedonobacterales bacterium]
MSQRMQRPEVVVITGASGGVGRATAQAFGKRGAHVCLVARGEAGLEGAKRDIEQAGGKAIVVIGDAADPQTHERAAQQTEETFGPIDIWINVAFTTVFAPFMEITPEEYKRVTEVTYLGYVYGTQAALRRMIPRDRGKIVEVGSTLAYRSIPLQSAYCGAKHAIQGFTTALRSELIHNKSHVQVTMAELPAVNTPQFTWGRNKLPRKAQPVPPIYQPEVIADAVYWLAHHKKRQIFIGGSTAIVIIGNKFLPGFGDWYLGKTGYNSQMRPEERDPNQPDNLYEPVDTSKDYGAHGAFDDRSINRSYELWAAEHKGIIAGALAGIGGLAAAGLMLVSRQRG